MAPKGSYFLLPFVLTVIHSTAAQIDCETCVQTICGSSDEECRFIQQPKDACIKTKCNAELENAIIRCDNTTQSLLRFVDSSPNNCVENRTYRGAVLDIHTGFYIVGNAIRFCSNQCIFNILISSKNNPNLPHTQYPIQFHLYKRYNAGRRDYFIQQQSFNVSIIHISEESMYEATPVGPAVCFDSGDYIGMTLTEDIGLAAMDGVVGSAGSYINPASSPQCSGITSPVFNLNRLSDGPVPRITVVTMPSYVSTSTGQTTSQSTGVSASQSTGVSASRPTGVSASRPTEQRTTSTADPTVPLITVLASGCGISVIFLIVVVILYKRKKKKLSSKQGKCRSSSFSSEETKLSEVSTEANTTQSSLHPLHKSGHSSDTSTLTSISAQNITKTVPPEKKSLGRDRNLSLRSEASICNTYPSSRDSSETSTYSSKSVPSDERIGAPRRSDRKIYELTSSNLLKRNLLQKRNEMTGHDEKIGAQRKTSQEPRRTNTHDAHPSNRQANSPQRSESSSYNTQASISSQHTSPYHPEPATPSKQMNGTMTSPCSAGPAKKMGPPDLPATPPRLCPHEQATTPPQQHLHGTPPKNGPPASANSLDSQKTPPSHGAKQKGLSSVIPKQDPNYLQVTKRGPQVRKSSSVILPPSSIAHNINTSKSALSTAPSDGPSNIHSKADEENISSDQQQPRRESLPHDRDDAQNSTLVRRRKFNKPLQNADSSPGRESRQETPFNEPSQTIDSSQEPAPSISTQQGSSKDEKSHRTETGPPYRSNLKRQGSSGSLKKVRFIDRGEVHR